jgi:5-formyltetrahydrofolate cyclo-ligase
MNRETLTLNRTQTTDEQQRQALRRLMRRRRTRLTPNQQQLAARDICRQVSTHPALQQAEHIALYYPFDGEIDTQPLCQQLWQQRKQLYLPTLDPKRTGELLFFPYTRDTQLQCNRFGIPEPFHPLEQACPLAQLMVIFLPVVAFDTSCQRLGMGGGYYDRTLNAHLHSHQCQQPLMMIGLAHDFQCVPLLPCASWDRRLNAVMTPHQLFSP